MKNYLFGIMCVLLMSALPAAADNGMTYYTPENSGLPGGEVRAILIDPQNGKWFGTKHGLARFNGLEWTVYGAEPASPGIAGDRVQDLAYDGTGGTARLWVATDSGATLLDFTQGPDAEPVLAHFRTDNSGLVSNRVRAVEVDEKNATWFGTDQGVSMYDGNTWSAFTWPLDLSQNEVISLGADRAGWKYIGTASAGVSRLHTDEIDGVTSASPYDTDWSGLLSNTINGILLEPDGNQWYATGAGAAFHDSTETKMGWQLFLTEDGLVHDRVLCIAQDSSGAMWFGAEGGLSRHDGLEWKSYTTANGLPDSAVLSLAVDRTGLVWIGSNSGVTCLDHASDVAGPSGKMPAGFELVNHPNPFNASTTLTCSLPAPGDLSMQILDARGRRIASRLFRNQPAGLLRTSWDGRNRTGEPAPSGIYIAILFLDTGGNRMKAAGKLLLVR
ncbi:hypothetical protein JW906_02135 [bacterium]|nr:hypothetical protein [bacterium]